MSSNKPNISIIICTRNRTEHLRQTLEAMRQVSVPAGMFAELCVIDNGSTDNTASVVNSCHLPMMPVHYIYEGRQGQCYARNTGVNAAKGEIILFTDDDVRPPVNWIKGMCEPIQCGKAEAVAGGVSFAPHLERDWMELTHRQWLASTEGMNEDTPERLVGANMAFHRKVLGKVPGFDTQLGPGALGFYDETLFTFQLREAGFRLKSAFNVSVEHHFDASRLTYANMLSSADKMGRSYAYVMHHWMHQDIPKARLASVKRSLKLNGLRLIKRRERIAQNGVPEWELSLAREISCYRQFLLESKLPRNYEKLGLVRITHG
jgi:glycosyltransferase involved in cell wall biosynthesis